MKMTPYYSVSGKDLEISFKRTSKVKYFRLEFNCVFILQKALNTNISPREFTALEHKFKKLVLYSKPGFKLRFGMKN